MTKSAPQKPASTGYLAETSRPAYALAMVLPMLLFYEIGIIFVRQTAPTSDKSDWLIRRFMGSILSELGFHGYLMSGVLVAAVLVAWQIFSRKPWEVRLGNFLGMVGESALYAAVIAVLVVLVLDPLLMPKGAPEAASATFVNGETFREAVLWVGAGVYEEFVFRFLLVGITAVLVHAVTGVPWKPSIAAGVVVSALLFSTFHFVGPGSWPFTWTSFIARAFVGVFFGVVFLFRGFGIAAGTHVMYNFVCEIVYQVLVCQ